jgi:trehalose 6-phosphate phosphatase
VKRPESRIWTFDFDGTLSHLVSDRKAAVMDSDCRQLLTDLAGDPEQIVAVVSSRSLEDLRPRVQIENVVLAGGSGLEWWLPGEQRLGPNQAANERLGEARERILPGLLSIQQIPGVDVEDKLWSAAIHFRQVADPDRVLVARELENLHIRHGVSLHYGPEVAEVQFLPEVSKEIAVKTLFTLFSSRSAGRHFVYAGDDQNDAQAMRWVLERRGVVYIVGRGLSLAGAQSVADPTALARDIRERFHVRSGADARARA